MEKNEKQEIKRLVYKGKVESDVCAGRCFKLDINSNFGILKILALFTPKIYVQIPKRWEWDSKPYRIIVD